MTRFFASLRMTGLEVSSYLSSIREEEAVCPTSPLATGLHSGVC